MRRTRIFAFFLLSALLCFPLLSGAQQFTFDSPALAEQTTVSFSLADSDEQLVGGSVDSSRSSSRKKGAGTLVIGNFVVGVRAGSQESEVQTATTDPQTQMQTFTSDLQSEITSDSAFVGWHFRNVFSSSSDVLTFLVGRGSFNEKNFRNQVTTVDPAGGGAPIPFVEIDSEEETDVTILRQYALIYRLPWLLVGFSRADVVLDYSLQDNPSGTLVEDRFVFSFTVTTLGLKLFDEILRLDYERRDNPGAQGQTLRMESIAQTFQSATLDFGVISIFGSKTTSELELTDFFEMKQSEESFGLKFAVKENLSLTLRNTRSTKTESVLYTATPVIFETEGESNEITFIFKFTIGSSSGNGR